MAKHINYGNPLRCYDNGGKTADRYTIIPPRWDTVNKVSRGTWAAIGSSTYPFHPQGFGQHFELSGLYANRLGKRVHFDSLPPDVRRFALQAFPEYNI